VSVKAVRCSIKTADLLPILRERGVGYQQKNECDKSHGVVIERCVQIFRVKFIVARQRVYYSASPQ